MQRKLLEILQGEWVRLKITSRLRRRIGVNNVSYLAEINATRFAVQSHSFGRLVRIVVVMMIDGSTAANVATEIIPFYSILFDAVDQWHIPDVVLLHCAGRRTKARFAHHLSGMMEEFVTPEQQGRYQFAYL